MERPYGSLLRRTAAALVDMLLITICAWVVIRLLGKSADVQFVAHGLQAAYWILMQSRVGSGQTVGKKLLDLRVVALDGSLPSVGASAVRWFIAFGCSEPAILAYQRLGPASAASAMTAAVLLTIPPAFAMLADTYLVLANRTTRRSLHDIASGTVVVRADHQGAVDVAPLWGVHRAVVAALAVLVIVFVPPMARFAAAMGTRTFELMDATTALRADARITNLGVVPMMKVTGQDTAWTVYVVAAMRTPAATVAQQDSAARALACGYATRAPRAVTSSTLDLDVLFESAAEPVHYEVTYLAATDLTAVKCQSLLQAFPLAAPAARPIR